MDSDVLNVVVALVVIFGIFRWWSKPSTQSSDGSTGNRSPSLGFRPHHVTPNMISSVQAAFPQEPRENIHYDLLRTGNVQVTSNKLIEKGLLPPPPPAYFARYPEATNGTIASEPTHPSSSPEAGPSAPKTATTNLITRLGLENRVSEPTEIAPKASGKAAWLSTAQEREASLRERKAQMVLAARQRLLEKQKKAYAEKTTS